MRAGKRISLGIGILLLLLVTSACKTAGPLPEGAANASWLQALIQQLQKDTPANPPASIYSYTYNRAVVYYLSGRCCDIPGKLYNASGDVICEPDGGITGRGDGRCPDFFEKRTDEKLIWEDKRLR